MSWEEQPLALFTTRKPPTWGHRRCTNCRAIGYCPPCTPCRLCRKGTLDCPPAWTTYLAPRDGNNEPEAPCG